MPDRDNPSRPIPEVPVGIPQPAIGDTVGPDGYRPAVAGANARRRDREARDGHGPASTDEDRLAAGPTGDERPESGSTTLGERVRAWPWQIRVLVVSALIASVFAGATALRTGSAWKSAVVFALNLAIWTTLLCVTQMRGATRSRR